MKTAVSIPDDVFEQAERMAHDLNISRSELYARALRALVHHDQSVTDRLNRVHDAVAPDPAVEAASRRLLLDAEW